MSLSDIEQLVQESARKIKDYENELLTLKNKKAAVDSSMCCVLNLAELQIQANILKSKISRTQSKLETEQKRYDLLTKMLS